MSLFGFSDIFLNLTTISWNFSITDTRATLIIKNYKQCLIIETLIPSLLKQTKVDQQICCDILLKKPQNHTTSHFIFIFFSSYVL